MDGVLLIDKAAGMTSHDVVARVRRIISERRVGHTGTLDPFATGVMVLLVGRATRLAQFLAGAEKEYEAVIRLGYATDTGDLTGSLVNDKEPVGDLNAQQIENAMARLRGEIDQVPPMYSAKKHQGRKLYELARKGEEIEREPVRITVHKFETIGPALLHKNADETADLDVRVVCSAGTYVRTLAEDFGKQLEIGAHLSSLRRTRAGDFHIDKAVTLEELQQRCADATLGGIFLPMDAALSSLPFVHLTDADAKRVRHGLELQVNGDASAGWPDGSKVRLRTSDGELLAIGIFDLASEMLHPRVVLA